jgi:serine/threonine-protein kinase RsbW
MSPRSAKPLLAGVVRERFVGRNGLADRLYLHSMSEAEPFCLRVSGPPVSGVSELLRQVYDRLFREQRFVVPFYFALRPGDAGGASAAARYAYQFLLQAIAFKRNDPALISGSPDICELAKMAPLADAEWVDKLCESCGIDSPLNDDRAFIRSALAAPLRAAADARMRVSIIVDDLHNSASLDGGRIFIDELSSLAATIRSPLILGARRRFAMPRFRHDRIELGPMSHDVVAGLAESMAIDAGISMTEQVRDRIAVQFGGRPSLIRSIVNAARESGRALESFRDFELVYVEEILTGEIGNNFDEVFKQAAPDPAVRQKLIELLYFAAEPQNGRFPLEALRSRLGLSVGEFNRLADLLEVNEILAIEMGSAELLSDTALFDFLNTRHHLETEGSTPAKVTAMTVTNALKRAPRLMSRLYRREAAAGLMEILLAFDTQEIPKGLIDYRQFREKYKGVPDDEALSQLAAEDDMFLLPQVSHAAPIVEHFPGFGEIVEPERAIAGVGFTDRAYRDEDQITWLAVEINSKIEADHILTHEWCERLDAAADACGFSNYRVWLVAPEGFSEGALEVLSERNWIGSSRRQIELLRGFLKIDRAETRSAVAEYEMVIPVGEETELVAAHALEEIARRYGFPSKAINQIKTALVEACINAAEHGLSLDRKIYLKFAINEEEVTVTISNRGLRLIDRLRSVPPADTGPSEGRRGWGLSLIRGLMDEVRIEAVDDGTRIEMTKYVKA